MSHLGDRGPLVVMGAGPAGSLLALYLARAGHRVTVFERRPDLRRVDVGAGRSINLALATRGLVPLRQLGLDQRVEAITVPMAGRMVHAAPDQRDDGDGTGVSFQPYGTTPDEVIRSVSRSGLNTILLDAAEATGMVTVAFEQRCLAVDPEAGLVELEGPDGRRHHHRFGTLFGCDGAGSVVRRDLVAANGGSVTVDQLDHGYKELTLPPGPDGGFRLDPGALHIWPRGRMMLIALPNPEGDFTVTLFLPHDGTVDSFAALAHGPAVSAFFRRHFPDVVELVPGLDRQWEHNPTGRLATVRTRGWSLDDRCVLVGDAAHAIVPFHGQGMNAAMESCRLLVEQLERAPDDVAGAFAAFEADRRPDTDAIADMALDNYEEMRADVVDPAYRMRRELALELSRRHPDRFAHRYGMVMFTTMPYAEVLDRARRQQEVLVQLTDGVDSSDQVDRERADRLIDALGPLPHQR